MKLLCSHFQFLRAEHSGRSIKVPDARQNWNSHSDRGSQEADFEQPQQPQTRSPDSMRLTLAWLCVCLAIYCSGGFANNDRGNVVLSLPPSLIAATEVVALRQLQQQQQREQQQQTLHEHPRWKKDARVLFDSGSDSLRDIAHSKESASEVGKYTLAYNNDDDGVEVEQQPADLNRKVLSEAYDLEARRQSAPQEIAPQHGHGLELKSATPTPHKYWASRCQSGNGNCPREYHRAMLTIR